MQFAIYCKDKAGSAHVRADNRPAHLEHLKKYESHLVCTGPLLTEDGQGMVGSLLVVEFPDRSAAEAFAAADPYAKAKLFQSVEITPFRKVFPQS
jgi:uncharacterized protein YciI